MSGTIRILAIEDDVDTQANLRDILELDGYAVDVASRVSEALNRSNWSEYTAILLDRRLPDGTAEELLPRLVELAPSAGVVVVTGHADFEGTITAMRLGVSDYLLKPINPEALLASVQRIVRVRQSEERAQQAERLAAIGETMAVLAHESRNAFQLASASLDMLEWNLAGNDDNLKLVERVRNHQARVCRLFEDVQGYAAPIQLDRRTVDITTVLRDSADHVRTLHPSRTVRIDIQRAATETASFTVSVDVSRMEQVFRNLLENSIAACPDPVEIGIACAETDVNGEPTIEVCYRDNGPGLSVDCRRHLFEPFFTTKPKGTGLGMAITRRIIEAHGGSIMAAAPDGHSGAEFLIKLPAAHDTSSNESP
ncbi:MAG: signal transduction histidine kinase [Planctomycetaceae bacterium]|jgi:signal transduction histidine kinase